MNPKGNQQPIGKKKSKDKKGGGNNNKNIKSDVNVGGDKKEKKKVKFPCKFVKMITLPINSLRWKRLNALVGTTTTCCVEEPIPSGTKYDGMGSSSGNP
jgi:hypothetical protein